jgi:glycosyltransferase involved in cell wall biosynthesis
MACFKLWGDFLDEVVSLEIPICTYSIQSLHNPGTLLQQLRLARFLIRHQVEIVHTYGFYASVFALPAAKLARVPATVVSIRDTGETLTDTQKRLQRLACRFADSVLVNAEAVREWLVAQGCAQSKITVIRNGIEPRQFQKTSGRLRTELGIAPEQPLIGMISRLNRLKGTEYFLQAAAALAPRFPKVCFLVVGDSAPIDPEYKLHLERQAAELGLRNRVVFTGYRKDIAEILSELSVSVLPSLSEGLSNVLLESMAAGVPTVATRVGGNSELIENGISGLLIPPSDANALADALHHLLQDPRRARQLGQAASARIAERFSLTDMVQRTEEHYLKLLGARRPVLDTMEAVV